MYVDVFLFILYGYDRVSYVCQFFMMGLYLIKLILFLTETEMMIFEVNMVCMCGTAGNAYVQCCD